MKGYFRLLMKARHGWSEDCSLLDQVMNTEMLLVTKPFTKLPEMDKSTPSVSYMRPEPT